MGHVIGFEPMPPDSVHAVTLNCHPQTPSAAVHGISARVGREPGDRLAVTYILEGDFNRLRVPAPRAPGIASRLWEHTCCEVFIACKGLPAYYEFNFSPSGEWASYAFDGYRSPRAGESKTGELDPQVVVRGAASKLELDAVIRLDRIPALQGVPLSLSISAVVEDSAGALSYWALRHPAGKPDFHHSEAFALELGKAGG